MTTDNRRAPRHRCKIRARIAAGDHAFNGHVIDVSMTGFRLLTDEIVDIWTGMDIETHTHELGVTKAKVCWRSPGRLGAKVDDSVDMKPRLEAYRKFYNSDALG